MGYYKNVALSRRPGPWRIGMKQAVGASARNPGLAAASATFKKPVLATKV